MTCWRDSTRPRLLRFEQFEDRRMLSGTPVTFGAAQAIDVPGNVNGTIAVVGEVDLYQVELSEPGFFSAQTIADVSSTLDPALEVLNDQGEALVYVDDSRPGTSSANVKVFLETGVYYLAVSSSLADNTVGEYVLTASLVPGLNGFSTVPLAGTATTLGIGGLSPDRLVTADFDENGTLDAVAVAGDPFGTSFVDGDSTLFFVPGNGDGTFQVPQSISIPGALPSAVAQGDIDHDGHRDLAVGTTSSTIAIFLGTGTGGFQFTRHIALPASADVLQLVDLNADDNLDLVAGSIEDIGGNTAWSTFVGLGNGEFESSPVHENTLAESTSGIAFADFDNNGLMDIAGYNSDGVFIKSQTANGGYSTSTQLSVDALLESPVVLDGSGAVYMQAADFDGNGLVDLVVGRSVFTSAFSVLLNRGQGDFEETDPFSPGASITDLAVVDYDDDGTVDLVFAVGLSDSSAIMLGDGEGGFHQPINISSGQGAGNVAVGAFDESQQTQALLLDRNGLFLTSAADVSFGVAQPSLSRGNLPAGYAFADINADGRSDVVVANRGNSFLEIDGSLTIAINVGDGRFETTEVANVGNPSTVVTADFNQDGRVDLLVGDNVQAVARVLLGLGNGEFVNTQSVNLLAKPEHVIVNDVNDDGFDDVIIAEWDPNYLEVFFGDGTGQVVPDAAFVDALSGFPQSVRVADTSGDNWDDIVVLQTDQEIVTFDRVKDGIFAKRILESDVRNVAGVEVGDFDLDGISDLVVAGDVGILSSPAVRTFLQSEDGEFSTETSIISPTLDIRVTSSADFDGDGLTDIVAAGVEPGGLFAKSTGVVIVLRNLGAGGFEVVERYALQGVTNVLQIAAQDMNSDDRPDVVLITDARHGLEASDPEVSILLNFGGGSLVAPGRPPLREPNYTPRILETTGGNVGELVTLRSNGDLIVREVRDDLGAGFRPPQFPSVSPAIVDFSRVINPGIQLVASISDVGDRIEGFSRTDEGGFQQEFVLPLAGELPGRISSADLNGDGWGDLVISYAGSGELGIFISDSLGGFHSESSWAVGSGPTSLELVDVTGDDAVDILVVNERSGSFNVLVNDGTGVFSNWQYRASNALFGLLPDFRGIPAIESLAGTSDILVGDFNSDQVLDIATANEREATLGILIGKGNGAFINAYVIPLTAAVRHIQATDFNEDGKLDVAALQPGTDAITILLGDGQGSFTETYVADAGNQPGGLSVHDIDADGHLDLLVGNEFGDLLILRGNGDGTFQSYERADSNIALAVADIDGDGVQDSVLANQSLDGISIRLGDAGQKFRETDRRNRADGLIGPGAVEIVDMDSDGINDIVVANSGSNNLLVFLGQNGGVFDSPKSFFVGTNPKGISSAQLTDDNGDGVVDESDFLDLVVANQGSNDVSVLLSSKDDAEEWTLTAGPRLALRSTSAEGIVQGLGPVSTEVTDFNEDGIADVAVANSASDNVFQLLGLGNGFFNDQAPIVFPTGVSPQQVLVGTFDAFPGIDLLTVNAGSDNLTLYSGFSTSSRIDLASGGNFPLAAVAQDLNDDGALDLLVANYGDGAISLLLSGEDGLELFNILETGLHPTAIALADLGNDLSLLVASEGDELVRVFTPREYMPTKPVPADLSVFASSSSVSLLSIIVQSLVGSSYSTVLSPLFVFANTLFSGTRQALYAPVTDDGGSAGGSGDVFDDVASTFSAMLHEVRKVVLDGDILWTGEEVDESAHSLLGDTFASVHKLLDPVGATFVEALELAFAEFMPDTNGQAVSVSSDSMSDNNDEAQAIEEDRSDDKRMQESSTAPNESEHNESSADLRLRTSAYNLEEVDPTQFEVAHRLE